MAKRFVLPPQIEPMLEQLWQNVANGALEIAEQAITAVFGNAFRGGKLDAAHIAGQISTDNLPDGVVLSGVEAGMIALTVLSGDETAEVGVTFPIPYVDPPAVVVTPIDGDFTGYVVPGSVTATDFTAGVGTRGGGAVGSDTPLDAYWHAARITPLAPTTRVWLTDYFNSAVYLLNTDGSATGIVLTGNDLQFPLGVAQVGDEVWVLNSEANTYTAPIISRFAASDGSALGSVAFDSSVGDPDYILVIGDKVWVSTRAPSYRVTVFNFDTSIAFQITEAGLIGPYGLAYTGSEIFVANWVFGSTLWRYDTSGASTGSPLGSYTPGYFQNIVRVDSSVWLGSNDASSGGDGTIAVIDFAGTQTATVSDAGLTLGITGMAVVGDEVWVVESGSFGNPGTGTIYRFAHDGTPLGSPITSLGWDRIAGLGVVTT